MRIQVPRPAAPRRRTLRAIPGGVPRGSAVLMAGHDAGAWICGLLVAGWCTRDLAGVGLQPSAVVRIALVVGPVLIVSGLFSALLSRRCQRGSLDEVLAVTLAVGGTALVLAVLGTWLIPSQPAPVVTVAGAALFALPAMLAVRYLVFAGQLRSHAAAPSAVKVIVFGAGSAASQLIHRLTGQSGSEYQPAAVLDDNPRLHGLWICGIPVSGGRDRIAETAAATGATVLVIAIARASGPIIRELVEEAERCGLTPKVVPSVRELLNGSACIEGVRDPQITDLLGRRPVQTDIAAVAHRFAGKRILVTGAGGSIGSELCRQLHRLRPAELIMLDHDESALHAIQLVLHGRALLDSDEASLVDIRDAPGILRAFQQFRPQIVFHAAALKHLPLLERYPAEAVESNVRGTLSVLEAARACGVESFVNISTDKAADPGCVLGYSKRIAERLTADMARRAAGTYLSVRFGNVLGSRGSVLPAMSAQVAAGGPITVTHPQASRYFMTADEAVQLVLQAAAIGRDGEVLVLDMGEQVLITDVARRLAAKTAREIEIVYTGLRPGEKITENLLGPGEADDRPRHPLISQVMVPPLDPGELAGFNSGREPGELRADLARLARSAAGAPGLIPAQGSLGGHPPMGRPSRPRDAGPPGQRRAPRSA